MMYKTTKKLQNAIASFPINLTRYPSSSTTTQLPLCVAQHVTYRNIPFRDRHGVFVCTVDFYSEVMDDDTEYVYCIIANKEGDMKLKYTKNGWQNEGTYR